MTHAANRHLAHAVSCTNGCVYVVVLSAGCGQRNEYQVLLLLHQFRNRLQQHRGADAHYQCHGGSRFSVELAVQTAAQPAAAAAGPQLPRQQRRSQAAAGVWAFPTGSKHGAHNVEAVHEAEPDIVALACAAAACS